MSGVTVEKIKQLRDITGVGMGKCKQALTEANGDLQKAITDLRKAGMTSAVKKEGREANEGFVGIAENDKAIALVELNAETDFVSQNEKFSKFLQDLANQALNDSPKSLEEFVQNTWEQDTSVTIEEARNLMVQTFGENILIKRVEMISKKSNASYGIYSHMGGKIASVIELEGSDKDASLARDIAMHVAAEDPEYISAEEVPAEIKEREEDIARTQAKGKPEQVMDKIVQGKFQAYCNQMCLLSQKYVKDSDKTVGAVVEAHAKEVGSPLKISKFWRWQVGK